MSFLSEDERIKQRIHYFGYQAFWITFWLLIACGFIFGGFPNEKIIEWFYILPSIAIFGLVIFTIRIVWDGIEISKFNNQISNSPKKLILVIIFSSALMFIAQLLFHPEHKNHLFRSLCSAIIYGLLFAGLSYLEQKVINWRNKKALGSEKDDIES